MWGQQDDDRVLQGWGGPGGSVLQLTLDPRRWPGLLCLSPPHPPQEAEGKWQLWGAPSPPVLKNLYVNPVKFCTSPN